MNASQRWDPRRRSALAITLLRLRLARLFTVGARARPPFTLSGGLVVLARTLWVVLALLGALYWILAIPVYHRHALSLQTTDCCVVRDPIAWRAGLRQLGLSPSFYAAYRVGVESLLGWSMFLVGLLIFLRKSDEWIALFVSITLLSFGMTAANDASFARSYPHELAVLLKAYGSLPFYAFFLVPLVFPDGRFVPRWAALLAPLFALQGVSDLFFPRSVIDSSTWPEPLESLLEVVVFGALLIAPIYRYRYVSDSVQRRQTKWAMLGLVGALAVFLAAGSAVPALVPQVVGTPGHAVLYDLVSFTLVACAFALVSVAFGVAILRYHLWDIDVILNRTMVYVALTACVIGLYALVVAGLGTLFALQGNFLLSLLAAVLVALLFQPLRERLQRGVNRLMYGERDEPYAVISDLGRQLEGTLSPDAVLPVIVHTVAQALRLPYAAVALRSDMGFTNAAAVGAPANGSLALPLLYQGDIVGQLILGLRSGETAFSPVDRRLLEDLAHQAGVAAYAVRLTNDLQHSRQRLVTAREEERRRLRRDLHDGLGPALASMAMQSEAARDLLTNQPAQSDLLLADLTAQLQEAITDIRHLIHDLRPPALDDLGLTGALRNQIGRFEHGGLRITFDAPAAMPSLPAAVEVAVYRIILEALNNVVRHAEAETCCVRLSLDKTAERLCLEVSDDGRGLSNRRPSELGLGLASIQERAAELGGSCVIEAGAAGGTRVCAVLPITVDRDQPPVTEPIAP